MGYRAGIAYICPGVIELRSKPSILPLHVTIEFHFPYMPTCTRFVFVSGGSQTITLSTEPKIKHTKNTTVILSVSFPSCLLIIFF